MKLALNLARACKGLTGENPPVGCVIVKNNEIISIGQTSRNGRPHAEQNAIKNSLDDLRGSKMYVTLEPCNHYGKTPPCTSKIIKSGISEVFYSMNDIDKKVKGKSFKLLMNKNIKVKRGLLIKEAIDLYDSYKINRIHKLPYVTGKIAISKNKIMYSENIKRITNSISDKLSHYLRFKNDGIMVSSKTLNIDNSKLNCRLKGYEKFSPKRIIIDKNLKIKLNSYVFKTAKKNNTLIFHNSKDRIKIKILRKKGINLFKSKLYKREYLDLKMILKKLYSLGINNLLVEGGNELTKNFFQRKLFNRFFLFENSINLPKRGEYLNFTSQKLLNEIFNTKTKTSWLAKDKITIYKR